MVKYILIWFCIGVIITGIDFYKRYHFDVNDYMNSLNIHDVTMEVIRRSESYTQIFVAVVVIVASILWPYSIYRWFKSFK